MQTPGSHIFSNDKFVSVFQNDCANRLSMRLELDFQTADSDLISLCRLRCKATYKQDDIFVGFTPTIRVGFIFYTIKILRLLFRAKFIMLNIDNGNSCK